MNLASPASFAPSAAAVSEPRPSVARAAAAPASVGTCTSNRTVTTRDEPLGSRSAAGDAHALGAADASTWYPTRPQ